MSLRNVNALAVIIGVGPIHVQGEFSNSPVQGNDASQSVAIINRSTGSVITTSVPYTRRKFCQISDPTQVFLDKPFSWARYL